MKKCKIHQIDLDIVFLFIGDSIIKNINNKFKKYKNVIYLDFRDNIGDYINMSDLIISTSRQEGLPQNILEAMYFNKMIITTNIRGHRDLITKENGILCDNLDLLIDEIIKYKHIKKRVDIFNNIDKYRLNSVMSEHVLIYNHYLNKKIRLKKNDNN